MKSNSNVIVEDMGAYVAITTGKDFQIILKSKVDEVVNPLIREEVKRQIETLELISQF